MVRSNPDLCGLNVTIPYKEQVLAYIDEADQVVQEVKAANCIHVRAGRLVAYNTDVIGFERSLLTRFNPHHTHALILGTGGASKAVGYVLHRLGLQIRFVSRKPSANAMGYEQVSPGLLAAHTLVVNTTPLGMYPATDDFPALPYEAITPQHYFFDLVYNPAETIFLRNARLQGAVTHNGADMLEIQAEESWKIWNAG